MAYISSMGCGRGKENTAHQCDPLTREGKDALNLTQARAENWFLGRLTYVLEKRRATGQKICCKITLPKRPGRMQSLGKKVLCVCVFS